MKDEKKNIFGVLLLFAALIVSMNYCNENSTSEPDYFVPKTDTDYRIVAVEAIKKQMHNPKSFDLDFFTIESDGSNHIVKVSFYGTNGFGGVVKSYAKVTITPYGKTEVELLTLR